RSIEGMDYVMETQPALKQAFSRFWWKQNESRSDRGLDEMAKNPPARSLTREQAEAIARQSADNIEALKPYAEEIATRILAWCLSRNLEIDDWREFSKSRKAAGAIFDALAHGSTPAEQAAVVGSGAFGTLHETSPIATETKEDLRKQSLTVLAAAP